MKQVTNIPIDAPIQPNQGIGEILLGMNSFYLKEIYADNFKNVSDAYAIKYDKNNWKSELWKPFFGNLNLHYKDFLIITINLYNGCISHLKVKNSYRGKVNNLVGIGDGIRKFYEKNEDYFCELIEDKFFFWIDKHYGLSFKVGNNLDEFPNDELFEQYLDYPIQEIQIFDETQRIAVGADLPNDWK